MKQKHKQHEDEHADETWLIPYADLLTLLLALFIVLFASSKIDVKKFEQISLSFNAALAGGSGVFQQTNVIPITEDPSNVAKKEDSKKTKTQEQVEKETVELKELKKKLDQYIEKNGLLTQLETKLNNSELQITISDNALFASGSATVKPEAQKLAGMISTMLVQYPEYEINVAGHTDDRPISTAQFNSNWDLSSARALNFMKYLLENKDLQPQRFSSIGHGEYRPIDTNDTEAGRAKNRRVEVSIMRKFKDPDAAADNTVSVGQ